MDLDYILTVKQELAKTNWTYEMKEILKRAVKELREKGYSDLKIRELFEIESLKEQDNSQMIANNARYMELLNEILNS